MNEGDKLLESFFGTMREADRGMAVPDIQSFMPLQKKVRMPEWAAIAAAVNIVLFLGVVWYHGHISQNMAAVEPATEIDKNLDIMTWQTPTDQLLSDF